MAALDIDAEALDVEIIRHLAERAAGQQFERGVGALIGVAERLSFLHLVEQAPVRCVDLVPVHIDADALQFGEDVRLAGLIGDQHLAADAVGRDVLIGARIITAEA